MQRRPLLENISKKDTKDIRYAKNRLGTILRQHNALEIIKSNEKYNYMIHVILHRKTVKKLASEITIPNYVDEFSQMHDIEKIGLCLSLDKSQVRHIHKAIAQHHNVNWNRPNKDLLIEKAIDWESCHYTKLNSQQTAYEYCLTTTKASQATIKPILKQLNFWKKYNKNPLTQEQYDELVAGLSDDYILSEVQACYDFLVKYF